MRFLSLLFALLLVTGCDSSDDRVLDAQFYDGTWELTAISDDSGDRTAIVGLALDNLTIDFDAGDGSFALVADFNDTVNGSGQADVSTEGTYQARASVPSLILTAGGLAAPFTADTDSDNRVELTAPGVLVNALLAGLPFSFDGNTTLEVTRR